MEPESEHPVTEEQTGSSPEGRAETVLPGHRRLQSLRRGPLLLGLDGALPWPPTPMCDPNARQAGARQLGPHVHCRWLVHGEGTTAQRGLSKGAAGLNQPATFTARWGPISDRGHYFRCHRLSAATFSSTPRAKRLCPEAKKVFPVSI